METDRETVGSTPLGEGPARKGPARKGPARKGRGAVTNPTGRFEPETLNAFDDGWSTLGALAEEPLRTTLGLDTAKTVITRNRSPDVPFDRSINPYRGCEHGCIYCFARPSHAYLGLSPGLDFETKLFRKPDAARLLREELAKPAYRADTIVIGTNTDPYQPVERAERLTRAILEVMAETRHPTGLITKSAGVIRDRDLLAELARHEAAMVCVSITTLDRELARRMEPRCSAPEKRLAAVEALAAAGVPVAVLTSPMIPGLNDHEMEAILDAAARAGAVAASYTVLRLPLELKDLFTDWIDAHYPDRKTKILNGIRDLRGGDLYDSRWGHRMKGRGVLAELYRARFARAVKRLGLNRRDWELNAAAFRKPSPQGQGDLFL